MKTDTYQHNSLNRRVLKVTSSETRGFWYNRNWQCVEERVGDFSLLHMRYCWGLRYVDDLIFRECDSKTTPDGNINQRLYAIADPNWNIVAMGANAGSPHERFTYNAFGTVNCFSGTFGTKASALYTTRFFTGQVLDAETGLMLYRNRVYHPRLGRFVQRDPIGYEAGDVNLMRYVRNMAEKFVDPFGLQMQTVITHSPFYPEPMGGYTQVTTITTFDEYGRPIREERQTCLYSAQKVCLGCEEAEVLFFDYPPIQNDCPPPKNQYDWDKIRKQMAEQKRKEDEFMEGLRKKNPIDFTSPPKIKTLPEYLGMDIPPKLDWLGRRFGGDIYNNSGRAFYKGIYNLLKGIGNHYDKGKRGPDVDPTPYQIPGLPPLPFDPPDVNLKGGR